MSITIKLDTKALEVWARDLSAYRMKLAIKSGLNKAARAARTSAIEVIALDEGVSQARAKKSISKLSTASPSNLKATWSAGKQRIGILSTTGAKFSKGSGLTAATHRITGGRSAAISQPKAFIINANGGRVLFIRRGKGKKNIKAIFAENPNTALAQENAAGRKVWQKTAETRLPQELNASLTAVLRGASPPSDSGSNE